MVSERIATDNIESSMFQIRPIPDNLTAAGENANKFKQIWDCFGGFGGLI